MERVKIRSEFFLISDVLQKNGRNFAGLAFPVPDFSCVLSDDRNQNNFSSKLVERRLRVGMHPEFRRLLSRLRSCITCPKTA